MCMGEATPEDNPGEGKHKKRKTQSNSSIFFPASDMMASNRSMHTNPKCQKVCMFVTKMCFFLSLRENDIWQFNLATKALPSFLPSFRFCCNGVFEALAENTGTPPDAASPMSMTVE